MEGLATGPPHHRSLERTSSSGAASSQSGLSNDAPAVSSKWRTWAEWTPGPSADSPALASAAHPTPSKSKDKGSDKDRRTKSKAAVLEAPEWADSGPRALKYTLPTSVGQWHAHTLDAHSYDTALALNAASWAGMHPTMDALAVANTSRARNEFRILRLSPADSKADKAHDKDKDRSDRSYTPLPLKIETVTSWVVPNASVAVSWGEWTMAIAKKGGGVEVVSLQARAKSGHPPTFAEQPKSLTTLNFPAHPAPVVTADAGEASLVDLGAGRAADFHSPDSCLALDLSFRPNADGQGVSQRLVAIRGLGTAVWDLARPDSVVHSVWAKIPPRVVRWAPQWTGGNNYIRASVRGTLKIFDLRLPNAAESTVWKQAHAHVGAIRDIRWSPFVAHWFATAGEDAVARVWDLRYAKGPVLELSDHSNSITSISWCPVGADLLATGSSDRSLKVWNLRTTPHCVIGTIGNPTGASTFGTATPSAGPSFDSAVVSVGWTNTRPYPYLWGLSATGGVTVARLRPQALASLAPAPPHHSPAAGLVPSASGSALASPAASDDSSASTAVAQARLAQIRRKIEEAIYAREFGFAFERALRMAIDLRQEAKLKDAKRLLEICYARPALDLPPSMPNAHLDTVAAKGSDATAQRHTERIFGTMPDIDTFKKEMKEYSYYIPPNYGDHLWPAVSAAVMVDIEVLKLNLELEQYIRKHAPHKILRAVEYLIAFLERGLVTVDAVLLHRALALLLPHDTVAALHVGASLSGIYASWQKSATEAASSGAGPSASAKFHSPQAAMVAAGGSGNFTPGYSFVDADGLGSQYFLNIINSLLAPFVYADEAKEGPENRRRSIAVGEMKIPDALAPGDASSRGLRVAKRPLFGLIFVPESISSFGFGVLGGLRLSHDLKLSAAQITKQLMFMRDFYATLWGPKPFPHLFSLVEAFDADQTLSLNVDLNRIYLNSLLMHKLYDKFYIKASRLVEQCKLFGFATQVTNIMISVHSKFRKFLQESRRGGDQKSGKKSKSTPEDDDTESEAGDDTESEPKSSESEMPVEYQRLQRALQIVVSILTSAVLPNLPKNLPATLPVWLKLFAADMRIVFFEFTGVAVPLPDILIGDNNAAPEKDEARESGETPRTARPRVVELDETAPLQARHARRAAKVVEEFALGLRSLAPQDLRVAAAIAHASQANLPGLGTSGGLGGATVGGGGFSAGAAAAGASNAPAHTINQDLIRALDVMLSDFVKRAKRRLVAAKQGANRSTASSSLASPGHAPLASSSSSSLHLGVSPRTLQESASMSQLSPASGAGDGDEESSSARRSARRAAREARDKPK